MDVDGTLLDFDEAERRGVRVVMEANGMEPSDECVELYHRINAECWRAFERGDITREQIFERRYPQFFGRFGVQVDAEEVERLYRGCLDGCCAMIDGALEICEYLSRKYDLYVVTNGISETQYRRLEGSGLGRYFKGVFVSEDAGSQKPQMGFFEYCFSQIVEKDRGRMMIIGDSLTSDIKGGANAGIVTCWVNLAGRQPPGDLLPDYEVHSLMELRDIL